MKDPEIIESVLAGNREDFALLVERYKDMAYTIAVRMLGERTEAEEVVQEAFIKAFSNLGTFRRESGFSTWLFRIVYNGAVSRLRTRKRTLSGEVTVMEKLATDEPDYIESEERDFRKQAVLWGIAQLKPVDRAIITLFYHEERSLREIGEVTGLHEDVVKMRLHRARKKMKQLLETKFRGELSNVSL